MAIFGSTKTKAVKVKKQKSAKKVGTARARKLPEGMAHDVLLHPWFSEKALLQTEQGVYAFAVPQRATKAQVAGAVLEIYKVAPRKIRIVNLPGKSVSKRSAPGHAIRAKRRKAYVYLKQGDTIQFA